MTEEERDVRIRLQGEQIDRLERALAELAEDLHRVSNIAQVTGTHPALASLLAEHRAATENGPSSLMRSREFRKELGHAA